jgi:hypothetical protein
MPPIREEPEGRFDERGDHRGGCEQDADLAVTQVKVGPDQGKSGGERAEDELVEEFDREKDRRRSAVQARQLRRVWHPVLRMRFFGARGKQLRCPS